MDRREITVPGGRLAVRLAGEGPALVLLHGFGGDGATWDGLLAELAGQYRCIVPDLRGFGASRHGVEAASRHLVDAPTGPIAQAASGDAAGASGFSHAEDVLALLDALGEARAVLAGVSLGGAVAIDTALAAPDRVSGLVLISPGLSGWAWSAPWRAGWRAIAGLARGGDMAAAKALWWAQPLFDSLRDRPEAAAYTEGLARYSGREWGQDAQRPAPSAVNHLHALTMPLLLLSGGRDVADFADIAAHIAAHVPDGRWLRRDDLGHLLHLEDPAWVLAAMRARLA